jgi:hypothetical protein
MDPQIITKLAKVAMVVAGLYGVNISPEHQQIIIEAAVVLYGLLAGVEAWDKRRKAVRADKV